MISLTPEQSARHKSWIDHFQTKYSFDFGSPTYTQVPFASQYFKDKDVTERVSRLEQYLLGTYPINMGTNDQNEMSKLKRKFTTEEYAWHIKHNKLGTNCWGTPTGIGLIILNEKLRRKDLHIPPTPYIKYDTMTFQQKIYSCATIDKQIYEILKKLVTEKK